VLVGIDQRAKFLDTLQCGIEPESQLTVHCEVWPLPSCGDDRINILQHANLAIPRSHHVELVRGLPHLVDTKVVDERQTSRLDQRLKLCAKLAASWQPVCVATTKYPRQLVTSGRPL